MRLHLIVAVGLTVISGCGGSSGGAAPADNTVAAVLVSPGSATLVTIGEQLQLDASAGNSAGLLLFGKTFAWSSSDPDIVTVDAATGLVTVAGDGVATITAETDGVTGTALITARLIVDRVQVAPAGVTVLVGESVQLSVTVFDLTNLELLGRSISWSSADDTLVSVDGTGLVTGIATGDQNQPVGSEVFVTATVEGESDMSGVQVRVEAVVNSADDVDDGTCDDVHCNLREAVNAAGWGHTTGTIRFNIPGPGPHTIQPAAPFPNGPSFPPNFAIDGYSQPGAAPNTAAANAGTNAVLMIEIDGSLGGGVLPLSNRNVVQGLVMNRGAGLSINTSGGGDNVIQGNFLGTDVSGSNALGATTLSLSGDCDCSSENNLIGGTDAAARNLIARGISLGSNGGNTIQGNLIGTDASGTVALGSGTGLSVASSLNLIGGSAPGAGNLISGNTGAGITLSNNDEGGSSNVIQGNFIGTDVTGTVALGNTGPGIVIDRSTSTTSGGNHLIGGTGAGEGNIIAFNGGNGVTLAKDIPNNRFTIGTAIQSNAIFSNGGLSIDLDDNGVTVNDLADADDGSNNLQNYPVLVSAVAGAGITTVNGTLNSSPSTDYRIEFFSNAACDSSGYGEGERYIGAAEVTTDSAGDAGFSPVLLTEIAVGSFVTATATAFDNNTSEFSQCVVVM